MNKKVKELWVEALRGGVYTQLEGGLRHTDTLDGLTRFCCLGVLCDLHAKAHTMEWECDTYMGSISTLPSTVAEWAGLGSRNQHIACPCDQLFLGR